MRLELSRFIESDLDDIAGYIAQDNPQRAVTFIYEIRVKFHEIRHNPLPYQLRPDIGDGARMATIGSYSILFRVTTDVVRIERVVYGAGIWQEFSAHDLLKSALPRNQLGTRRHCT